MSRTILRLKRLTAIITFTALVACTDASLSRVDTSLPQSETAKSVVIERSETARSVTVPIRTSKITIQFDAASDAPLATLSYDRPNVPLEDMLYVNSEVIPVVAQITGCNVIAHVTDNQLLPARRPTTIPLRC